MAALFSQHNLDLEKKNIIKIIIIKKNFSLFFPPPGGGGGGGGGYYLYLTIRGGSARKGYLFQAGGI